MNAISTLVARLTAAADAYHNGKPLLMTDEEFDAGVDQLSKIAPTHPFLAQVGAPVAAGDEVALPIPLPSLNKIKPDGGIGPPSAAGGSVSAGSSSTLEKWLAKFPAAGYHVSVKLDGCSALWLPAAGRLYTRGDGMRGRDISAFIPHFKGLVKPKTGDYAIRGELIMRTDSEMIPAGKLARNIVAGALNRKADEADPALFGEIRFMAYGLERPVDQSPEEAFKTLRQLGYETAAAATYVAEKMTPAFLSERFSAAEAASPYQLDGIVVAPNVARPASWAAEVRKGVAVNPADRVAWKTRLTASTARTRVRAVEWNVSHGGMLIPRVLFDPVVLAGATIGAATGLHGRWISENAVGPGAEIEIRRAGDVIPQIIAIHTPAPAGPSMPTEAFAWDGVHVRPAVAGDEQQISQLVHALSELGAENVGPGVVAKLYAAGLTTLRQIYGASQADFAARVEGVKAKGAEKIWTGLRAGQAGWNELAFLCASCTMPRGVGHSKLKPLLEIEPSVAAWTAARLGRPAGLSDKTVAEIVAAVPAYLAWRTSNFPDVVTMAPSSAPPVVTKLAGPTMTVVLTGFRGLEAAIQAAGHQVTDTVSKKTTHVVYPDGPKPTSTKITKAEALGFTVLTRSEFEKLLTT